MKNTILRGKILTLLAEFYPNGIEHSSLISIYYQYEKVDDIEKSVQYLVDKDLVLKTVNPHPFKEQKTIEYYKITPDGLDVVEGNVDNDPGIIIPMEV